MSKAAVIPSTVKRLRNRVPECLPRRLNWVPPSPASECGLPPSWVLGGATLACGGGGGETQFRRLDRHPGTLYSNLLYSVHVANSFLTFRFSIFSYVFNPFSLTTSDTIFFQLSLLLFFFPLGIGGIPASIISVRYRTGLSLFWCRTGSGIGLSFYSITGLTGYRTVQHSGILKNCTKGGGSVRVQRISESAV
jgi:hypothetical protein